MANNPSAQQPIPPRLLFRSESPSSTATSVNRISSEDPNAITLNGENLNMGLGRRGPGGGLQPSPVARPPNVVVEAGENDKEYQNENKDEKIERTVNVATPTQTNTANADLFARFEALQRELQRSRDDANNSKLQTPTKSTGIMSRVHLRATKAAMGSTPSQKNTTEGITFENRVESRNYLEDGSNNKDFASTQVAHESFEQQDMPKLEKTNFQLEAQPVGASQSNSSLSKPPMYPTSSSPTSPFGLQISALVDFKTNRESSLSSMDQLRSPKDSRPSPLRKAPVDDATTATFYDAPHLSPSLKPTTLENQNRSVLSTVHVDTNNSPKRLISVSAATASARSSREASGDSNPTLHPTFEGTMKPSESTKVLLNSASMPSVLSTELHSPLSFTEKRQTAVISIMHQNLTPAVDHENMSQHQQLLDRLRIQLILEEERERENLIKREWTTHRTLELEEHVAKNTILTEEAEAEKLRSAALQEELVRLLQQRRESRSRSRSPRIVMESDEPKWASPSIRPVATSSPGLAIKAEHMSYKTTQSYDNPITEPQTSQVQKQRVPSISSSTVVSLATSTHNSARVSPRLEAYGSVQPYYQQTKSSFAHYFDAAPKTSNKIGDAEDGGKIMAADNGYTADSTLFVSDVRNDFEDTHSVINQNSFGVPSDEHPLVQQTSAIGFNPIFQNEQRMSQRPPHREIMAPQRSLIKMSPNTTADKYLLDSNHEAESFFHPASEQKVDSKGWISPGRSGSQKTPSPTRLITIHHVHHNQPDPARSAAASVPRMDIPTKVSWPINENFKSVNQREKDEEAERIFIAKEKKRHESLTPPRLVNTSRRDQIDKPLKSPRIDQSVNWSLPVMNRSQRLRVEHAQHTARVRTAPPSYTPPRQRNKKIQKRSSTTIYERYRLKQQSNSDDVQKTEHKAQFDDQQKHTETPTRMSFALTSFPGHPTAFAQRQNELHEKSIFAATPKDAIQLRAMTPPPRVIESIQSHVERLKITRTPQPASRKARNTWSQQLNQTDDIPHSKLASRTAPDTKLLLGNISGKIPIVSSFDVQSEENTKISLPLKPKLLSPPQQIPFIQERPSAAPSTSAINRPQPDKMEFATIEPLKTPNISDLHEADLKSPERHILLGGGASNPINPQHKKTTHEVTIQHKITTKPSVIFPFPKGYRSADLLDDFNTFSSPQRLAAGATLRNSKSRSSASKDRASTTSLRNSVDRFTEDSDDERVLPLATQRKINRASLYAPSIDDDEETGTPKMEKIVATNRRSDKGWLFAPLASDDQSFSTNLVNGMDHVPRPFSLEPLKEATHTVNIDSSALSIPKESIIFVNLSQSDVDPTTTAAVVTAVADPHGGSKVVIVSDVQKSKAKSPAIPLENATHLDLDASNALYKYSEAVHEQQFRDLMAYRQEQRVAKKKITQSSGQKNSTLDFKDESSGDERQHFSDPSFSNPKGRLWRPGTATGRLRDIVTPSRGEAFLALVDHGSSSDSSNDNNTRTKKNHGIRPSNTVGAALWAMNGHQSLEISKDPSQLYDALSPLTPQNRQTNTQAKRKTSLSRQAGTWMTSTASWKEKRRPTGNERKFAQQDISIGTREGKLAVEQAAKVSKEEAYWEQRRQHKLRAARDLEVYKQKGALLRQERLKTENKGIAIKSPEVIVRIGSEALFQRPTEAWKARQAQESHFESKYHPKRAISAPKSSASPSLKLQIPSASRSRSQPLQEFAHDQPRIHQSTQAKPPQNTSTNYLQQFLHQKQVSPTKSLPQIMHDTKHVKEYLAERLLKPEIPTFPDTVKGKPVATLPQKAKNEFNNPYLPEGFTLGATQLLKTSQNLKIESKPNLTMQKPQLTSERKLSKLQRDALQKYQEAILRKR